LLLDWADVVVILKTFKEERRRRRSAKRQVVAVEDVGARVEDFVFLHTEMSYIKAAKNSKQGPHPLICQCIALYSLLLACDIVALRCSFNNTYISGKTAKGFS
jgi:hypothetical protein